MSKVMDVLKEATDAFIAGDTEKYMSLMSERTRDGIEKLGGIDSLVEVSNITIEKLGTKAAVELILAMVNQYKLVDGKLESVSLEALSKTESFDDLMEKSKEGLEFLTDLISEEE